MIKLSEAAFIPPHIRKRCAANDSRIGSEPVATAVAASPTVSEKSRTHVLTRLASSPHSAKIPPRALDSSPSTPPATEIPVKDKKVVSDKIRVSPPPRRAYHEERQHHARGANAAPKRNKWPKSREMRCLPAENEDDDGASFKSYSNGDPDYDVKKLLDWNGDWLPPPEQWSARKGFSNRHLGRDIEIWIDNQPPQCIENMSLESHAYRGRKMGCGEQAEHILVGGVCKELVPRYWMSTKIEGKTLQQFWVELPDRSPDTVSDIDIAAHPPWWELYEHPSSCFITGLAAPDARVNLEDAANHVNPSGFACAKERIQAKIQRDLQMHQRTMAKRNRPLPEYHAPMPSVPDWRIQPTINIYLRPVRPADVRGITEIYNHYVENTIHANEFDVRSEHHIRDRVNGIIKAGLPYIVAVVRSNSILKTQGPVSEKIVGYINLDDHCDQSSMYRFTFEMELLVHPGFTHKGIGKCLLDQLVGMVNPSYRPRGGYEYINEDDEMKSRPTRVVKTILFNVHHICGEDTKWVSDYLRPFRFVRAGHLSQVGFKKNQVVDKSIYQHHTAEDIDPRGIPTVPLERD